MTSKFANFDRKDVTYKTVKDHPIKTAILTPKGNTGHSGKRPVLVHLHGGFLIIGDKVLEQWTATWLIRFAESKGAIIVSPDYRLLPEATGSEVLEDLASFWEWMHRSLATELSKMDNGISADLSSILVAGESAGGYLAVQSALLFPSANICAVISQYGMIDMQHPHLSQAYEKHWMGTPPTPESMVDDYLKSIQPGAIRTSTNPPHLGLLIAAIIRNGRYLDFLGNEERLFPVKNLKADMKIPPMWILHGDKDSFVPLEVSGNFVQKMKETKPDIPLLYSIQPGEHGFDAKVEFDERWVKEGCAFIDKYWPGAPRASM